MWPVASVAKIGVNCLAPVGRWAAETAGTVVKDVAHFGTPMLGVEPEIESRAQPDPADKLLSKLRRMAPLGFPQVGNTGQMIILNGGKPWPD